MSRTLCDTFAAALRLTIQTSILYEDGIGDGQVDQICSTILSTSHRELLKHLNITFPDFQVVYCTVNALQDFPPPFADNLLFHPVAPAARGRHDDDDDPVLGYDILGIPNPNRNRFRQQAAPPTNLSRFIQTMKRLIVNVFVDPWSAYLTTEKSLAINREVLRLSTSYFDSSATAEAAMIVDQEPSVEPTLLSDIIKKAVDSSTKSLKNEINNLKNQLKQKSTPRGPTSGASGKKKTDQATSNKPPPGNNRPNKNRNGKAAEHDNVSSSKNSNATKKTSTTSTKQSKKNGSKQKRANKK